MVFEQGFEDGEGIGQALGEKWCRLRERWGKGPEATLSWVGCSLKAWWLELEGGIPGAGWGWGGWEVAGAGRVSRTVAPGEASPAHEADGRKRLLVWVEAEGQEVGCGSREGPLD